MPRPISHTNNELLSLAESTNHNMIQSDQTSTPDIHDLKRQRLVGLLRGYFTCPVIAAIGELGLAERMLAAAFTVADFEEKMNVTILKALLRYLQSIGLITEVEDHSYTVTPEGRTAITRNGAFSLLMSYAAYFNELPELLVGNDAHPTVNRLRNVRGSGQLHGHKFFPAAFRLFSSDSPAAIIDIGCGDGCFLAHALEMWPGLDVFGVDLSPTAVRATQERLSASGVRQPIAVTGDGFDVNAWNAAVPQAIRSERRLVVSLWFVAHEFSRGIVNRVVNFFLALHRTFPLAQVLVGEICQIAPEVLAENYNLSIMPEFLLFHALSGQGVLSWNDWQEVLQEIPFTLKAEKRFDEVQSVSGASIPASFIWLLEPRK